ATSASLPPWHLLELLGPSIFGSSEPNSYWPGQWFEWHERLFYIGVIPLLAALRTHGRWRWACWASCAVAVALAMGRYVPWYAWAQVVLPGYGSFRVPSRHLTLAALGLSLAAGLGIQRLRGERVARTLLGGATLTLVASLVFAEWFPPVAAVL